jgi:hypothetical protein
MTHLIPEARKVGNINFKNFLKRFTDFGFNYGDCVGELIDNSIDAKCSEVKIELHDVKDQEGKHNYFLYVIDDGEGMDMNAFEKFFEMYGDKDNQTLNSLGKKGIGGKVALVNLSQLNETALISKVEEGEMLFVRVPWNTITEPKSITVQLATRHIEELWDKHSINKRRGTVSRLCLPEEVYNSLEEIITDESFEPRNIYTLTCRNYFRFLQKGTRITFVKLDENGQESTLICKPIDPLHWDSTPAKYKKKETLHLFKDPSTGKLIFLKKNENGTYSGLQEREKNVTKVDKMDEEEVKRLHPPIVELCLDHAYVERKTEREMLTPSFENIKKYHVEHPRNREEQKAKDRIDPIQITLGTHLERNDKETGALPEIKKAYQGDFDIREIYRTCRHRVSFVCSADNDDKVDKLFKTQINKSKVDCNEIPHIIYKMITICNADFETSIVRRVRSEKMGSVPVVNGTSTSQTSETTKTKTDKHLPTIQRAANAPITNILPNKEDVHVLAPTDINDEETPSASHQAETSLVISKQSIDNVLTQTIVNGYARYSPVSDAVLLEILLDCCEFLKDSNVVSRLRNLCTTTTVSGHAELAKSLKQLKEHFEGLLENK